MSVYFSRARFEPSAFPAQDIRPYPSRQPALRKAPRSIRDVAQTRRDWANRCPDGSNAPRFSPYRS